MFVKRFIGHTYFGDFVFDNFYAKTFAKRSTISFFIITLLLLTCILRTAVITTGGYGELQKNQSEYKIKVAKLRGTIYDCNMYPFTNQSTKTVAAVSPAAKNSTVLYNAIASGEIENIDALLANNKPTVCDVDKSIESYGITTTDVFLHTPTNNNACHIIGYVNSDGHGVSGLEYAYDNLLYSNEYISAVFTVDGKGNVLKGIKPYFEKNSSAVYSGVVTTLDINIQNIVYNAAKKLNGGCAVVSEVANGKIRGMVSVPEYDINNITDSLQSENSPFINRVLTAYSVGSVFKPCVAVAAIESGKGDLVFECSGRVKIGDRNFKCHNLSGHGNMNLCTALAHSCNCYFYNLGLNTGAKAVLDVASALNFGFKIRIADNLSASSGNISNLNRVSTNAALANLSIGQGDLLLSPVAMLNLYSAIAGDGGYCLPSIVEKTIKNGVEQQYKISNKTRVMSVETAALLREYLKTVITDGTGKEAATHKCTAAGKTATAQTGRFYENGTEITNSWFCGFFPYENPKYTVVVMSDVKSNVSTASVFAEIVDNITELNLKA